MVPDNGNEKPTFVITNDFQMPLKMVVGHYEESNLFLSGLMFCSFQQPFVPTVHTVAGFG